jgi:hypothetical protein
MKLLLRLNTLPWTCAEFVTLLLETSEMYIFVRFAAPARGRQAFSLLRVRYH